ncbi:F-box domain containing protein, partial [Tanacetum coccineum]
QHNIVYEDHAPRHALLDPLESSLSIKEKRCKLIANPWWRPTYTWKNSVFPILVSFIYIIIQIPTYDQTLVRWALSYKPVKGVPKARLYCVTKTHLSRDSSQEGERAVIEPSPQPSRQRAESTAKMSAHVARSHGGDGGGDDRPPSHVVPTGCGGCFSNRGRGKRKPNLGGRAAGRLNTRDKTRNLSLKDIAETKGPVPITFEVGDKQTLNPLGPHAANWSNYIGEVVRSVPLYYPSWEKVPKERKAAIISDIGTLFDLRPHMESSRWTEIYEGINMHLQKAYNTNKASFKAKHWKADPTTGSYDVEAIRRARPEEITAAEWDKYIKFWNDPKNLARAAQNRLNRQKSVVTSRQGSRSLARLRDEMRQASDTQEYPSLIDTFWRTHTVEWGGDESKSFEARGPSRATSRPSMPATDKSLQNVNRKVDFMMSIFRSDSRYSDMFREFESGGASGSGGRGDDEEGGNDEDGEDEDDDGER